MHDNKKPLKVSIITVCYNSVATIERTIQSVIIQKYPDIEYIVIDGGSNDGTLDIIYKYEKYISKWVSEPDKGIYDAMNKGIGLASGDIIGIINSDDWYADDAVEKIVIFLSKNEVDVVYGRVVLVYADGSESLRAKQPLENLWYTMAVPHPSVFIKCDIYKKYGAFNLDYQLSSDYDLMLRLYSQHVPFGFVDDVIAYFRDGGSSVKLRNKGLEEYSCIFNKYILFAPDKNEILEKNRKWYIVEHFLIALKEKEHFLKNILDAYFKEDLTEIIIFGAGAVGSMVFDALSNEEIKIIAFTDNDSTRWNQKFRGILVISSKELYHKEGHVLIAVKNGEEEIRKQLEKAGNKRLKYVTLLELAEGNK